MTDLDDTLAASVADALDLVGHAATLLAPTTGAEPIDVGTVSSRELPDSINQRQYGIDGVRMADHDLLRPRLGVSIPGKDWVLTIADGAQAGTWTILGIERQDGVIITVRGRIATRSTASAPGARRALR